MTQRYLTVYNIEVSVRTAVEDLAASYEESSEVVRWYYAEKDRLREIENAVMEDQIVDLILEKASVTDEFVGFHEHRGTRGGNLMNDSVDLPLVIGLDRQNRTPVTLRGNSRVPVSLQVVAPQE